MKALVVYYSRTGTTKKVAEAISKALGCDSEQILDVKSRKGVAGYMRSGKEGMKRLTTDIQDTKKEPKDYEMVIIGTPIWGWNMSSPVRTYLENMKDRLPQVAFFCTMGGQGDDKAFREMEDICHTVPKAKLALTTQVVNKNMFMDRVDYFVGKIKDGGKEAEEGPE